MNQETIYVIGHKSPDTDTICSAIAYAEYLKSKKIDAVAARCGEINPETKYALKYFKVEAPLNLGSLSGKKVVLVDHNEESQSPDGVKEADIIEVIDHHKIDFSYPEPINFQTRPLGATATLIAERMISDSNFQISQSIAGILISAILSDTVIFKSNTTTQKDRKIAEELNKTALIEDIQKFGIDLKKEKSSLKGLSCEDIIYSDFKTFEAEGYSFGVGQIEVVDLFEFKKIKEELLEKINQIVEEKKLSFLILMATDIINEGSELLLNKDHERINGAFSKEIINDSVYLENVMSRKKDLLPIIMKALKN